MKAKSEKRNLRTTGRKIPGILFTGFVQLTQKPSASIPSKYDSCVTEPTLATNPLAFGTTSRRLDVYMNDLPGAGAYFCNEQIGNKNKESSSKKGYSVGFVSKTPRFKKRVARMPGPSTYRPEGHVSPRLQSNGSPTYAFSKPKKYRDDPDILMSNFPSPGQYNIDKSLAFIGKTSFPFSGDTCSKEGEDLNSNQSCDDDDADEPDAERQIQLCMSPVLTIGNGRKLQDPKLSGNKASLTQFNLPCDVQGSYKISGMNIDNNYCSSTIKSYPERRRRKTGLTFSNFPTDSEHATSGWGQLRSPGLIHYDVDGNQQLINNILAATAYQAKIEKMGIGRDTMNLSNPSPLQPQMKSQVSDTDISIGDVTPFSTAPNTRGTIFLDEEYNRKWVSDVISIGSTTPPLDITAYNSNDDTRSPIRKPRAQRSIRARLDDKKKKMMMVNNLGRRTIFDQMGNQVPGPGEYLLSNMNGDEKEVSNLSFKGSDERNPNALPTIQRLPSPGPAYYSPDDAWKNKDFHYNVDQSYLP